MPDLQPNELATRTLFADLVPGDRLEIMHEIKVGLKAWTARTVGTVVRAERRRHGLHFRRNTDETVWSDIILVKRDDGEETTVTIDEFTELRRL